jgi:phospholipase C
MLRIISAALAASLALSGCGGAAPGAASGGNVPILSAHRASTTGTPLQHIIVVVQENRSFNDLFATFPGVTGSTTGLEKVVGSTTTVKMINLKEKKLEDKVDLNHLYYAFQTAYDGGKMDGFNNIIFSVTGKPENMKPYEYVNPEDVAPYWTMASNYAIANAMFQTQGSGSFTAHQDLIRGGTELTPKESMIDDPTSSEFWGCDSPIGTKVSLITTKLVYKPIKGPLPCTTDFPDSSAYPTLQTLLDAASISWRYYTPPPVKGQVGAHWDAFDVIASVRYGSEWGTNVVWPETTVFSDLTSGTLPAVSWVIPDAFNSDHPHYSHDTGPSWVASIVNAVGQSAYWNTTAVLVVWDDWGGFYDPVAPPLPRDQQGGPGFRVPLIVISPYTAFNGSGKSPYISNTVYGFGSIVRFIEETFNLPSLGTTDQSSNSISDMFDFSQTPRSFTTIPSKYSRAYFLRQVPSGLPVDSQ